MSVKFTRVQNNLVASGATYRQRLGKIVDIRINRKPDHTYIYSDPGLGKSFTIENVLKSSNVDWVDIKGNTSLWGFIVDLACIMVNKDPNRDMFVFIDDCDNLLLNQDSVNTMKIALNDNKLVYKKALGGQYAMLDEYQQACIDAFRDTGRNGVEIPLDGLTFIWASNFRLADAVDSADPKVSESRKKAMIHQEALRRRMKTHDFAFESSIEKWGWIADCVLNSTPPSMKDARPDQLVEILDWMYTNWEKLLEQNISFAEKLFEEIEIDEDDYRTAWELDYLKK